MPLRAIVVLVAFCSFWFAKPADAASGKAYLNCFSWVGDRAGPFGVDQDSVAAWIDEYGSHRRSVHEADAAWAAYEKAHGHNPNDAHCFAYDSLSAAAASRDKAVSGGDHMVDFRWPEGSAANGRQVGHEEPEQKGPFVFCYLVNDKRNDAYLSDVFSSDAYVPKIENNYTDWVHANYDDIIGVAFCSWYKQHDDTTAARDRMEATLKTLNKITKTGWSYGQN